MILYKQKSNAVLYSLFLFKDLKLKLKFELKLKLKLLLLLVLGVTGADAYQTSVNHKKNVWIATDLGKHDIKQLLLCYSYDLDYAY